jgi:hypothetical protein
LFEAADAELLHLLKLPTHFKDSDNMTIFNPGRGKFDARITQILFRRIPEAQSQGFSGKLQTPHVLNRPPGFGSWWAACRPLNQ